MATAAAPLLVDEGRPRPRLVRSPPDLDTLLADWELALRAAERALAAAARELGSTEVRARQERMQHERQETAAVLRLVTVGFTPRKIR